MDWKGRTEEVRDWANGKQLKDATNDDDFRAGENKIIAKMRGGSFRALIVAAVIFLLVILLLQNRAMQTDFMFGVFLVSLGSVIVTGFVWWASDRLFSPALIEKRQLAGAKVRAATANDSQGEGVPIGGLRMPLRVEPQHLIIEGATGTGKTQLLKQMIDYMRDRGDTLVIVDSNYEMHRTFGRQGDLVLSPFDENSPGWLPHNEVRTPADWNALAETLIQSGEGNSAEWNKMARAFFVGIARGYQREVDAAGLDFDHMALFRLLTSADVDEIAPFLEGSAAASLAENEKGLMNIRMSFYDSLGFWSDLKPGSFSLRDWVRSHDRATIFIPHTKRTLSAARPLITTWLDQIVQEACDGGEDRERRVWIIIDELSSLGRIPALEEAVTELRKTGFRVVAGLQAMAQVQKTYGQHSAETIVGNLSNKVWFRPSGEATAERISREIGTARYRVTSRSESHTEKSGPNPNISISETERDERLVLASDLAGLPDLHAYVRWAGSNETVKTVVPIFRKE